mmetsp:Transcript_16598/g.55338  ORF Transcript_16598/g.55338 Transcript_16598/m.55338 type:complete len:252 (-) Transcript_16598:1937-2692(-)
MRDRSRHRRQHPRRVLALHLDLHRSLRRLSLLIPRHVDVPLHVALEQQLARGPVNFDAPPSRDDALNLFPIESIALPTEADQQVSLPPHQHRSSPARFPAVHFLRLSSFLDKLAGLLVLSRSLLLIRFLARLEEDLDEAVYRDLPVSQRSEQLLLRREVESCEDVIELLLVLSCADTLLPVVSVLVEVSSQLSLQQLATQSDALLPLLRLDPCTNPRLCLARPSDPQPIFVRGLTGGGQNLNRVSVGHLML